VSIDDQIDNYFAARQAIFEHVKYRERWRDMPFEDSREAFWAITSHKVKFSPAREALEHWLTHDDYGEHGDKLFENEVSDHAGESGIYRGVELTLVVADTNTDGNVFLQIFRNMNEITLCACGAMPLYVGDDGKQRCRECMFTHRTQQLRTEQKP
jgi:hypothetical protein